MIALSALNDITGKTKQAKPGVKDANPTNTEIEVGEPELTQEQIDDPAGILNGLGKNATSLKTLNPSRFVKVSNMFERDMELTEDLREELK